MLGRCLQVSSGLLWSRGQNFGKWKQRWFELTATHLVYFTSNLYREAANGSLPSGGAPPRAAIPLEGMAVDTVEVEGRPHCLRLRESAGDDEDEEGAAPEDSPRRGLGGGLIAGASSVMGGLGRASSLGRGGVVFKEYFFDAEEAHLAAAWLYEISLALAR